MLKLSGVEDKSADDLFYFGVFCDKDTYLEALSYNEEIELPEGFDNLSFKEKHDFINDLITSIIKGEIDKPDWMDEAEKGDEWDPDTTLILIPKDQKYKVFGENIIKLLNGVDADVGRDG